MVHCEPVLVRQTIFFFFRDISATHKSQSRANSTTGLVFVVVARGCIAHYLFECAAFFSFFFYFLLLLLVEKKGDTRVAAIACNQINYIVLIWTRLNASNALSLAAVQTEILWQFLNDQMQLITVSDVMHILYFKICGWVLMSSVREIAEIFADLFFPDFLRIFSWSSVDFCV